MSADASEEKRPESRKGWIRSAGFLFAAYTMIPILIGWTIGSHHDREVTGALVGLGWGVILAVWLVVRPLWIEADDDSRANKQE